MDHVVVVGGGLAGHRALQALGETFSGKVTLVGDEPHRPYDRPPLSKQVLLGELTPDDLTFACDGLAVDWRLGTAAVGLDARARTVLLADGSELAYDGVVIATGRRARDWPGRPAVAGLHLLRSRDDALALQRDLAGRRRVVIVGAGFVGCEVAASLRRHEFDVTLVDVAAQPMVPLGPGAGAFARRLHERHGVAFRLGVRVQGFEHASGRVAAVVLDDGEELPADVVVLALGSAPNTEWLEASGIELVDGNVACDEYCFARGVEDVVAAGDLAAWAHPHASAGHGLICVEHWSAAREMGRAAATNLIAAAGERRPFATVPTFWSDQYDAKIKAVGVLRAADRFAVLEEDDAAGRMVVEAFAGEALVGAVAFNRNKAFIGYTRALKDALSRRSGGALEVRAA